MQDAAFQEKVEKVSPFSTEFEFTLPKGFIDEDGNIHREGIMRLANAKDEIAPLSDPRVRDNRAYLVILILSRVVVKLGEVQTITPAVIERLFSADLSYLQEFYRRINEDSEATVPATCPACGKEFNVEFKCLGK